MRRSNFEILRLVAMFGIVTAHLVGYASRAEILLGTASIQSLYLSFLSTFGKIGVHIFFLISGYFLWKKEFSFKRLKSVIVGTVVYSIILGFAVMIWEQSFSLRSLLIAFFPITVDAYWFIGTYILIILLMPVLNTLIEYINKKKAWRYFYGVTIFFFTINLIGKFNNLSFDLIPSHRILTYILVYITGARIAMLKDNVTHGKLWLNLLISVLILCAVRVIKVYMLKQTAIDLWVADDRDFSIYLVAVSLFCIFKHINIGCIDIVNMLSASVFSVYLITENLFLRPYLWRWIDLTKYHGTKMVYIYPILMALIVTAICLTIDLIGRVIADKISTCIKYNWKKK